MRTPVCELLGIEQPIVQAPMSATPQLAAAVSNAGALGMLALTWSTPAGDVVRETAALTDRPFGGNLILASDQHRRLDEALEAGMRIVSLFWGDPAGYVEQVHDANGVVLHTVGSAEEAWRAAASGVDVVVAQGWRGRRARADSGRDASLGSRRRGRGGPVPVIAAGGIGDARGVAAVLALGAQAAWLGTRFLLAQEMPIHEEYRRRLMDAAETDAQWYANLYEVGWPDASHRALRNSTAEVWEAAGRPHRGVDRERAMSSPTSPPANRSSGTSRRRRWSVPPVISKRSRCGPDRALRSPGSHNRQQRSGRARLRLVTEGPHAAGDDDPAGRAIGRNVKDYSVDVQGPERDAADRAEGAGWPGPPSLCAPWYGLSFGVVVWAVGYAIATRRSYLGLGADLGYGAGT